MFNRSYIVLFAAWFLGALVALPAARAQTTWYVDDDAPLGGDGTSWPTAFKYLQDALVAATAADEVHVAGGIYKPDQDEAGNVTPGDRQATFRLITGVGLYGAYAGLADPNHPNQRDTQLYEAILSGDLSGDDDPNDPNSVSENSHHVVTGSATDETAMLDGFTITAGNASGSGRGGGMYNGVGSPTVVDCVFSKNVTFTGEVPSGGDGGGVCNVDSSQPTFLRCTFWRNSAYCGGGMYNEGSTPTVVDCIFSANLAYSGGGMRNLTSSPTMLYCSFINNDAYAGGGVLNYDGSSPTLIGCTFSGNVANHGGGMRNSGSSLALVNCTFSANRTRSGGGAAMYNRSSDVKVTNCTFSANVSAREGGAMRNFSSSPELTNCILWADTPDELHDDPNSTTTASYSDIQDGWPGTGNIDADPRFLDPGNDDFHLLAGSPCIDAGCNWAVPPDTADLDGDGDTNEPTPFDLDLRLRFADRIAMPDTGVLDPNFPELEIVDMGAYEYQCTGDLNGDGQIGLDDLAALLANYATTSGALYADGDLDQDGDVDLSDLAELLSRYGEECE